MKVLHIIPSAFEYFDDIRAEAFALLRELDKLGLPTDAFTLQYGGTAREVKTSVGEITKTEISAGKSEPTHRYGGLQSVSGMMSNWDDYDIIHLHCPFLGAARKILDWKAAHPDTSLLVTYYRPVAVNDLISLFIRWYNNYYLPKIFIAATAIICFDLVGLIRTAAGRQLKNTDKLAESDREAEFLARNLQMLYNNILDKIDN